MLTKEFIIKALMEDNDKKISELKNSIVSLKESLSSETKSSMGDKYETGRSMIQSELEKITEQYNLLNHQRNVLKSISKTSVKDSADFGSLLNTSNGIYFLGPGIGAKIIQNQTVYCVSLNSPIGEVLLGCKATDVINFKGMDIKLISID